LAPFSIYGLYLDGFEKITAIHNNVFGIAIVHAHLSVGIAKKRPAGGIDRSFADGIMCKIVWRFDSAQKGLGHRCSELGALSDYETVTPMLINDGFQLTGHIIKGLIPAGLFPLTGTALTRSDHGIF
jgi:hypothetical protein